MKMSLYRFSAILTSPFIEEQLKMQIKNKMVLKRHDHLDCAHGCT